MTGLLQDIDIPLIDNDWSRHGIEAQKMLAGLLPYQALRAIMAHDRNAGIKSVSKFSKSLEFADVVDNLSRVIPIEELRGSMQSLNFADLKKKYPAKLLYLRVIADFVQRWPEIRV